MLPEFLSPALLFWRFSLGFGWNSRNGILCTPNVMEHGTREQGIGLANHVVGKTDTHLKWAEGI
jgi:hypothetical protein